MQGRRYTDTINRFDFVDRGRKGAVFLFVVAAILIVAKVAGYALDSSWIPMMVLDGLCGAFIVFVCCKIRRANLLVLSVELQNTFLANSLKVLSDSCFVVDAKGTIVYGFDLQGFGDFVGKDLLAMVSSEAEASRVKTSLSDGSSASFSMSGRRLRFNFHPLQRPKGYFVAFVFNSIWGCLYERLLSGHGLGYYLAESASGEVVSANENFLKIASLKSLNDCGECKLPALLARAVNAQESFFHQLSHSQSDYDFTAQEDMVHGLVSMHALTIDEVLGGGDLGGGLVPFPICYVRLSGELMDFNVAFAKKFQSATIGSHVSDLIVKPVALADLEAGAAEEVQTKSGEHFKWHLVPHGVGFMFFWIDISEKKALEVDLLHSQKIDSLGKFAGGIAHDFNNILTVILSFSDLLYDCHAPGDEGYPYIMQIRQNVDRAATLVQQILAFSRKQVLNTQIIDMNELIANLFDMVKRIIGEDLRLNISYGKDLWPIRADRSQIEQVIINLVVNAKAAMSAGGQLTISTENCVNVGDMVYMDVNGTKIPEGFYVKVVVRDTGFGIDDAIRAKIFDPFFTTKTEGSGLGLSTVYGIVTQSGGALELSTELGKGSAFSVWLPRVLTEVRALAEDPLPLPAEDATIEPSQSEEKLVLVIEDEIAISLLISRALRAKGFNVLIANSGQEAMSLIETHDKIEVIISDIILTDGSGVEVVAFAKKLFPEIRVIHISGYSQQELDKEISYDYQFLAKPFSMKELFSLGL